MKRVVVRQNKRIFRRFTLAKRPLLLPLWTIANEDHPAWIVQENTSPYPVGDLLRWNSEGQMLLFKDRRQAKRYINKKTRMFKKYQRG